MRVSDLNHVVVADLVPVVVLQRAVGQTQDGAGGQRGRERGQRQLQLLQLVFGHGLPELGHGVQQGSTLQLEGADVRLELRFVGLVGVHVQLQAVQVVVGLLQLLQQLHVLLPQAAVHALQLAHGGRHVAMVTGRVEHLLPQHVVLHLVRMQLLVDIHLKRLSVGKITSL